MRIFITGILGQLGYNLACIFHLKGHHVEGSYHIAHVHPEFLKNRLYPLDFSSDFSLIDQLNQVPENIDILIHCAASTNVDQCEQKIKNTYMVNTTAPKILVNWAKQRNIRFIYMSTDFVFEGSLDNNHEDTLPNPKGHYSKSKLLGEAACEKYKNSCILRWTPLIHCFKLNHHPEGLLNKILSANKKNNYLNLFFDKTFSPVSSLSVAQTIMQQRHEPLLHVTCSESLSVYQIASIFLRRFGLSNRHYPSKFPIGKPYAKIRPQHSGMRSLYLKSLSIERDLDQCFDLVNSLSVMDRKKFGCDLPI